MSHVPAVGAASDLGNTRDDHWKPLFDGFDFSRKWIAERRPDVMVLVYNDHATALDLNLVPTFAIACGEEFEIADEGWGRRLVPNVRGAPDLAWHVRQAVIEDGFDLTSVGNFPTPSRVDRASPTCRVPTPAWQAPGNLPIAAPPCATRAPTRCGRQMP